MSKTFSFTTGNVQNKHTGNRKSKTKKTKFNEKDGSNHDHNDFIMQYTGVLILSQSLSLKYFHNTVNLNPP